jgi:hypothetical protein
LISFCRDPLEYLESRVTADDLGLTADPDLKVRLERKEIEDSTEDRDHL